MALSHIAFSVPSSWIITPSLGIQPIRSKPMFQAPASLHNNPLCQRPFQTPSCFSSSVLTTVRGGHEEGPARTHGRIPSLTIINTPDASVNERQRTKGINAAEPTERVTTMTSWVSWEPGMKRLQATPAQTHTHTQRALGQLKPAWEYGSVEEEESAFVCRSWKKAVVFGISGHAFLLTFLTILPTINCVIADTTASILDTLHHKKPQTIQNHTLTSETRVITEDELWNYKGLLYLKVSHGVGHISTGEITNRLCVHSRSER